MQQHALESHSDDIQRRLAMILGSEIGNIRTTCDRRISVIDVARAITGHAADYASQAVRNISDQYPEVREKNTDFKYKARPPAAGSLCPRIAEPGITTLSKRDASV